MTLLSIMSLKKRKSSPDISSVNGTESVGVRRSSSVLISRRPTSAGQSPDQAEPESEQLNNSLGNRMSLRSDELIDSHTFLKYNKNFHRLFPEVPEEESLTHTFTCSLQREVLYHGKLFVSKCHVCFYSSVLLKETKVVIPFLSVKEIKKYNSALSMLSIQTSSGDKFSFASLRNYSLCYKLLQNVCSQVQQQEDGNSSSPYFSSAENEAVSSSSSLESSVDQDSISADIDGGLLQMTRESREAPSTYGSTHRSSLTNEDDGAAALNWSFTEKVRPSVFREFTHFSTLFYIYVMLLLLLLLASGYIGLRITALEEQLSSLGALADLPPNYKEYQET